MAVDTAASKTLFDLKLIDELQLENKGITGAAFRIDGELPVYEAHVEEFRIGDVIYRGDFAFVDFAVTNRGLEKGKDPPIEGLIGAELLRTWNAIIDYKDLSLVIRNR